MPKTSANATGKVVKDTVNKNLDIPKDITKYRARKVLIMIRRMDRLAVSGISQVPMKSYLELLEEFDRLIKEIHDNDQKRLAEKGQRLSKAAMGERTPAGLDAGISADNPFTR